MSDFAQATGTASDTVGANTAASGGTNLTTGAANVKGAWAQLVAAAPFDVIGISVVLGPNGSGQGTDYLVDIGIGPAGQEQVLIPNIVWSRQKNFRVAKVHFNVGIPAGTRIAARGQNTEGSSYTLEVSAMLIAGGLSTPPPASVVTAYGADTSDSGGTVIDPGASSNTKGAWSQLTASVPLAARELVVGFCNRDNAAVSDYNFLVDIGIGPAGQEQVIVENIRLSTNAITDVIDQLYFELPIPIPEGVRLAARAQCDGTNSTDRLIDVVVYGVT